MSRRRRETRKKKRRHRGVLRPVSSRQPKTSGLYILDEFSVNDIRRWGSLRDKFLKYQADYYNELALQRSHILGELLNSIREVSTGPYTFREWYRLVRYKWSLNPLSTKGSLSDPGGRFNFGDIDSTRFPLFPALYIASDNETALQEALCQNYEFEDGFDRTDFALSAHGSYGWHRVQGTLESVIDLNNPVKMRKFVELLRDFKISEALRVQARELMLADLKVIQNADELIRSLCDPD